MASCEVFLYNRNEYTTIEHDPTDTCETVCNIVCRMLNIQPYVELLFGLRVTGSKNFVAPCQPLVTKQKFEFRIRYKVNCHLELCNEKFNSRKSKWICQIEFLVLLQVVPILKPLQRILCCDHTVLLSLKVFDEFYWKYKHAIRLIIFSFISFYIPRIGL